MELRSEDALRQVQERHLAAQADQIAQAAQFAAQDRQKMLGDLQMADTIHKTLTETVDPGDKSPEEVSALATQATDDWLLRNNPKAALLVGQARTWMAKPEQFQQTQATRMGVAQLGAESRLGVAQIGAQSREKIASSRAPNGYAPSVSEKDAMALQRAADAVDKAYADPASTPEDIARVEKYESDLRGAMERQHPDKMAVQEVQALRTELGTVLKEYWSGGRDPKLVPEIERLKGEIRDKVKTGSRPLTGAPTGQSTTTTTAPKTRFKLDMKSGRLVPAE